MRIEVPGHDIIGIRAGNPSPFTLTGTNSWIVGSERAWLIDPGPDLPEHTSALLDELARRGGLAGIALTHDHSDHSEAVATIRARHPDAELVAARGAVDHTLADGDRVGPFKVLSTPGHSPDHLAYLAGPVVFTGDAVLGQGSVFIAPDPGALRAYLDGLARLRSLELEYLCPGHGPLVEDPAGKLDEYVDHRVARERKLLAGLDGGARTVSEMLDAAWDDVPAHLRPAAVVTLAAHLDKLADEGRLPDGVQRPTGADLVPVAPR